MDVYDSKILATAKTKYINILETLEATLVVCEGAAVSATIKKMAEEKGRRE